MKRIVIAALLYVMALLSIDGCYIGFWDGDHDRGYHHDEGSYRHDAEHDRDGGHEGHEGQR